MAKIMIIDDDVMIGRILENFLVRKGHVVEFFTTGKSAIETLVKSHVDIVFCDFRLPDTNGKEILQKIKEIDPFIQVIIITAYSDIRLGIDVIKNGAFEYVIKPLLPDEVIIMVDKALSQKRTLPEDNQNTDAGVIHESCGIPKQVRPVEVKNFVNGCIVGKSKEARRVQRQIELVAPTNYSVVIYGESGTGKESVAYSVHAASRRKDKPFVAIDCGSLTKELAGSELFGHEKGAFTGALQSKIGQFELANGGTVFLDEISNLPYDIQVSLLRVIQERKIRMLGSQREKNIDVRFIVASNEKLSEILTKGKFREDLYHRFNEFSIDLPPLRERKEDIPLFADFFLQRSNTELNKNIQGFTPEVREIFFGYSWPGNLREMKNVVRRATLLNSQDFIVQGDLPAEIVFQSRFSISGERKEVSGLSKELPELKSAALNAEYERIMEVLRKVNFNKSKAALLLNIDRKTLYNKVKSYNLLNNNYVQNLNYQAQPVS